jgi:hypothetical protein
MKIFVSYRHIDSQYAAGRLDEYLVTHYSRENVFFDFETIDGGAAFRDRIVQSLQASDIVLPVIGASWLTTADERGIGRIESSEDLVRFEIDTAIRLKKKIIPVFLSSFDGWNKTLPDDLALLPQLHSVTLRPGRDFRTDIVHLMRQIGWEDDPLPKLIGHWHCSWLEAQHAWNWQEDQEPVWSTDDVVEIQQVLGHKVYAKGLNHKEGSFEMEGWWSDCSLSFMFSGVGEDTPIKGTVALKRLSDEEKMVGMWAQYSEEDDRVVGGPTAWRKMTF